MTNTLKPSWRSVLLLILVGSITAGQIYKLAIALPFVGEELQLTLVQRGWLFSVISLMAAAVGILAGSIADHFGMRRTLITGLCFIAVTSILGANTDSFTIALLLRILEGLGVLAVITSIPSLIIQNAPVEKRALALSAWPAYMPVGAALASLFGGWSIEAFGWRNIWLFTAALSLLAAVVVIFFIQAEEKKHHAPPPLSEIVSRLGSTFKSPAAIILCLSMLAFTMMLGPYMAWLPSFLIDQRGMEVNIAAYVAAIIMLLNIIGSLLAGWLLTQGFKHWQIIVGAGTIMLVFGTAQFLNFVPETIQVISALIFSTMSGLVPGTVFAAIPVFSTSAKTTGTLNGLIIQGAQLGNVVGPPFLAWLIFQAGGDWMVGSWHFAGFSMLLCALGFTLKSYQV